MNLYVLLKMVPDTVEELNVAADGKSLDAEFLRFKLSEPDDHALEQALLLRVPDHAQRDPVVARPAGIQVFQLGFEGMSRHYPAGLQDVADHPHDQDGDDNGGQDDHQ